jgi:hypothetical protein
MLPPAPPIGPAPPAPAVAWIEPSSPLMSLCAASF